MPFILPFRRNDLQRNHEGYQFRIPFLSYASLSSSCHFRSLVVSNLHSSGDQRGHKTFFISIISLVAIETVVCSLVSVTLGFCSRDQYCDENNYNRNYIYFMAYK